MQEETRATFGSKLGIIAATAGSAVGLGNVWRFPSETAGHGGALFIIVYIACVVFFGLPLVLAEFVLGRAGRANPARTYRNLAPGKPFHLFGVCAVTAAALILGFYMVVAGWTFEYLKLSIEGTLGATKDFHGLFADLSNSPWRQIFWLVISVAFTGTIVACGVKRGIELASKIMMPLLLLILLVMGVRALTLPGAGDGIAFLFLPKPENFSADVFASALGQSFFSLSLGMGCLITYSSYFGNDVRLGRTAGQLVFIDTFFALFVGMIIFSTAFAVAGADSAQIASTLKGGPGLVFETLPSLFNALPLGWLWEALFFFLLILATLTSAISLYEIPVSFISEEFKISRVKTVLIVSATTIILGCLSAVSLSDGSVFTIFGKTIFDCLDNLTANWLMPIGGLFVSWFTGWKLNQKVVRAQLENDGTLAVKFFSAYVFILRYVAPLGILTIFVATFF
ncbi:MAG: sodium-dependent transporter [Opitutae bacterium]|nr:sodium-dependent transporter [Opitutae bacterium]